MKLIFDEMSGQRDDVAAFRPGPKQAMDAKEAVVLGLGPQLAQDCQPGVAAVTNDVGGCTGASGDRRWRVEAALPDRCLDIIVARIAGDTRIEFVGTKLIQRDHHWGVGDGIAKRFNRGTRAFKARGQEFVLYVLGSQVRHGEPLWGVYLPSSHRSRWPPVRLARRHGEAACRH